MKRTIAAILTVFVLCSFLPAISFAQETAFDPEIPEEVFLTEETDDLFEVPEAGTEEEEIPAEWILSEAEEIDPEEQFALFEQSFESDDESERIPIDEAHFPDPAFRQYVYDSQGPKGKNYILGKDERVRREMHCDGLGISSLAGIEYFGDLEMVYCQNNNLTTLDLSRNPKVTYVECSDNSISSMTLPSGVKHLHCNNNALTSIPQPSGLEYLICENNRLSSLTTVSGLQNLHCSGNQLTSLDVSNSSALWVLDCSENLLSSLDLTNNPRLISLDVMNNQITSLDLHANTSLQSLCIRNNPISSLDLSRNTALTNFTCNDCNFSELDVSHNTALQNFHCPGNHLTRLDVSGHTALQYLNCNHNQLEELNITGCPSLTSLSCENNKLVYFDISQNTNLRSLRYGNNLCPGLTTKHLPYLEFVNAEGNRPCVYTTDGIIDLRARFPHFDPDLVCEWEAGSCSDGILTVEQGVKEVPYWFDAFAEYDENGNVTWCSNILYLEIIWMEEEELDAEKIETYVKRCYSAVLNREADEEGVLFWRDRLVSGDAAGADIVSLFCNSEEFRNKNLPNREIVTILYNAMLGRGPDADGLTFWEDLFNKGVSCNMVIRGFVSSAEFTGICEEYGIKPGTVELETRDLNPDVTAFVSRCYQYALERSADTGGLNHWTGILLNGVMTPPQVSYEFLFSGECRNLNLSDSAYIGRLYHLYMDRDADEAGLDYWLSQLADGVPRETAAHGFAGSPEFRDIMQRYGLLAVIRTAD